MARVVRLNSGGSTTIEKIGLTLEQAKELAACLRERGEPPGCAWCIGLEEEEEADAYMNFLNSMFSYWQGGIQTAERVAEPSPLSSTPSTPESSTATSQPSEAELPLENYDKLSANEVIDRIEKLNAEDVERLRDYETKNKNRRTVLERMNARISAASQA